MQLARSNNRVDKPYLMLQVSKICWDTAVMEYGPAVQASIGGVHLIDKIHTGCSGEYLELVSTDGSSDMITLLYRKASYTKYISLLQSTPLITCRLCLSKEWRF